MNVSKGSAPWGLLIAALFFALIAVSFYVLYDQFPELSSIDDEYGLMEKLNEMGGKTAVAGFFGVFAAGFGAWGLYRLVARQQAGAVPLTMSSQQLNIALQVGLEFTDSDLQANKQRQLSPGQQQKLNSTFRQGRWWSIIGVVFALIVLVAAAAFIFFLSPGAELTRDELLKEPIALVVIGVVFGVILLFMLISIIPVLRNSSPNSLKIEQTEGEVRLTMNDSYYGAICRLKVNRETFYLTETQAKGFWSSGRYRLYYLRWSRIPTLLSGEYLG